MTTSKGGRPATGSIKWRRNAKMGKAFWHAQISLKDGSRPWVPLDWHIPNHLESAGPLRPGCPCSSCSAARDCARSLSDDARAKGMVPEHVRETFEEYTKRWLDSRDGRVNSIRDDRSRMAHHVTPELGALDVRTFSRDDVERLRDGLDRKIERGAMSWKTAANVWTLVTSMCGDMVNAKRRDLRVREDNPCNEVKAPERGNRKAKQYLYPSEFLRLVSCEAVPLHWRRAIALAVYTYTRDGELRVLRWDAGDVDIEHGVLSITRAYNRNAKRIESTKSGETRRFAIEPNLLPLLRAMHDEAKGDGLVVRLMRERGMAQNLRRWLKKAGVTRPELHEATATRKALTWHDLRATGATWMAVRGDDPLKIKQRCGHATFSTTEVYIREAEAVREGFGEVFPPLPETLLRPAGRFRNGFAPVQNLIANPAKNKAILAERAGFEPAAGF